MAYFMFYCFANCGTSPGFYHGTGIAFSIIVGLANLAFAFYFKDIFVAIVNLLIYIDLSKTVFVITTDQLAEGIIDIFMVVASIGVFGYLIYKERDKIYK